MQGGFRSLQFRSSLAECRRDSVSEGRNPELLAGDRRSARNQRMLSSASLGIIACRPVWKFEVGLEGRSRKAVRSGFFLVAFLSQFRFHPGGRTRVNAVISSARVRPQGFHPPGLALDKEQTEYQTWLASAPPHCIRKHSSSSSSVLSSFQRRSPVHTSTSSSLLLPPHPHSAYTLLALPFSGFALLALL